MIHALEAADDEGIAVRLVTPESIRKLQIKLYCKAKQQPGFRFYALYDKVYRLDILEHAYELARANAGSPGVDNVSFAQIEAQQGQAELVQELAQSLQDKTYRAQGVRRVMIPKADGSERRWEFLRFATEWCKRR